MSLWLRRCTFLSSLLALLLLCATAQAAIQFPALSGRVVDNAGLLGAGARQRLDAQLAAHENATTNQVVVVTLESLQGYPIEDFGYQLGRHWGIGQKDRNNGVLLLIAPNERKLRIEVGYGLEGELTDAISANIINTIIAPAFKRGQFDDGITAGASAIIDALGGKYEMRKPKSAAVKLPGWVVLLFVLFIIFFNMFGGGSYLRRSGFGHRRGGYGGFGGGGFGGGGFGGGGGGFGGGGASGGW